MQEGTTPSLTTDKADYAPGEVVTVFGADFTPDTAYALPVLRPDGSIVTIDPISHEITYGWEITEPAGADGSFAYFYQLDGILGTYEARAYPADWTGDWNETPLASVTFTDANIGTYDQCANDDGDGYGGDPGTCDWINGNLQRNNSTYNEGDATVQRAWLIDMAPDSTHTVTFKYGTTKAGKHAYDYLTTWNWSENWITQNDLCTLPPSNTLISGCTTATQDTYEIPDDPNVPNSIEVIGGAGRLMTIAGGTITGISAPVIVSGNYGIDSETVITVSYTVGPGTGSMCSTDNKGVTTCGVMFWFGAHVALTAQWMAYDGTTGASTISGSPYHVALDALDGESVGQRDNQMQSGAVPLNGTIVIVKNAVPDDAQDFNFNLTDGVLFNQDFSLDDDTNSTLPNSMSFSLPAGTYVASEILPVPVGWVYTNLVCSVSGSTGSSFTVDLENAKATITLVTAFTTSDTVTCTYTDTMGLALTATKTADGSYDRTVTWTLDKSVAPANHEGYAGDSFDSTWTVDATKSEVPSNFKVQGGITINNPNSYAVPVTVSDSLSDGTVAEVDCDPLTEGNQAFGDVPGLGSLTCSYTANPSDNSATSNNAVITSGDPNVDGTTASEDITWSENLIGYDSGLLTDPRFAGDPWNYGGETISGDTTKTFDETFACSTNPTDYTNGTYSYTETNTAYLDSNIGLEASADVVVTCYLPALQVSKTAAGEWDRTVTWTLEKSVVQESYTGYAGDSFMPTWTVTLTKHDTGQMNWFIAGEISIYNPAAIAQSFTVADTLDDGTPVTVSCPSNTVASLDTVTCSYEANPDDDSATLNTATVSATGNADQTATADVGWSENLTGSDSGDLTDPRFSYDENVSASTTETFNETFACSSDASDYTDGSYTDSFTNDAYFVNIDHNLHADATVGITCYWPQIDLTKSGDELSKIGDDVTYQINLYNNTPYAEGLRDLECTISDPLIGFNKTVTLASGDEDLNTINFKIPSGASDPFENTASVSCSPLGSAFSVGDTAFWSTNLFQPSVEIVKEGPSNAFYGQIVTYTFTITNTGSSDSPKLVFGEDGYVDDDRLGDLTDAAKDAGCDGLAPGESCTFDVLYTVPDLGLVPNTITNNVEVLYHPDGFPNDVMDTDDHTISIVPKSHFTDTMYCPLPAEGFRLIFIQDGVTSDGKLTYKLNATNPGQFYYNVFYMGTPGSYAELDIDVPWPFITQGAVPIQVHDGVGFTTIDGQQCYVPSPSLPGYAIETYDDTELSPSGAPIITWADYTTQDFDNFTTVHVAGEVPESGLLYVTIHLDYGLKKTSDWLNLNPLGTEPNSEALNNVTGVKIGDPQWYTASYSGTGGQGDSDDFNSYNAFKKNPGVGGNAYKDLATDQVYTGQDIKVRLVIPKSVKNRPAPWLEATTDEDGFYMIEYKHTGKPTNYKFQVYRGNELIVEKTVELQGNEFELVDIYLNDGSTTPESSVHVGAMDSAAGGNKRAWNATVRILAVDGNEVPMAGANVSLLWSIGGDGTMPALCVTDVTGWCEVTVKLENSIGSITFTVTDIGLEGYVYKAEDNVLSGITVNKP